MDNRKSLRSKRNFQIVKGPAPLSFDVYGSQLIAEYRKLLEQNPAEKRVQRFFEKNPCLVPGGSSSHARFLDSMLITQPIMRGLGSKIPDFLWLAFDSDTWYPTLIEIERPGKRLFQKSGVPLAEFTQAHHQINQWRVWFSYPENVQVFVKDYAVPDNFSWNQVFKPRFVLVYGRQSEFKGNQSLTRTRADLMKNDEELISFDSIIPDRHLDNAITVRALGLGRFRAIAIQPTFTLGPHEADRLQKIEGIKTAIQAAPDIPKRRKTFLLKRLPYWQEWSRIEGVCSTSSGDYE